jgi:hypothetical protein
MGQEPFTTPKCKCEIVDLSEIFKDTIINASVAGQHIPEARSRRKLIGGGCGWASMSRALGGGKCGDGCRNALT